MTGGWRLYTRLPEKVMYGNQNVGSPTVEKSIIAMIAVIISEHNPSTIHIDIQPTSEQAQSHLLRLLSHPFADAKSNPVGQVVVPHTTAKPHRRPMHRMGLFPFYAGQYISLQIRKLSVFGIFALIQRHFSKVVSFLLISCINHV